MIDNISPRLVQRIRHKLVTNDHRIMLRGKYYKIYLTPLGKFINYEGHLFYRLNPGRYLEDLSCQEFGNNFLVV